MTRARTALALVVMLSAPRTLPAEPCAPRAELAGDAVAVAHVTAELHRLGVKAGTGSPGCRTVRAQVELDREGGIAVAIVDGSRRSEGRVVSDAGVAAAWIDSWLREDVDGVGWNEGTVVRHADSRSPTAGPPGTVPRDTAPRVSRLERFAVTAAYEQTWTDDGAGASGLDLGACRRIGGTCLGARVRYGREPDRVVDITAMRRADVSILATGSVSIALGRLSLNPELGVGVGRRSTQRLDCTPQDVMPDNGNCDPTDPNCMPGPPPDAPPACIDPMINKVYVGDKLDVATWTPRAAASVRLAVPLFEHVWLEGIAGVTFAPFGHTEQFAAMTGGTAMQPGTDASLPGEPRSAVHLGVGLRVGGR